MCIRDGFDALRRAVNQLSLEQLDWISPGRPRSMRQLLWHSFERPMLGKEAWEGGAYTEEMVRRYETLSQDYHTQADICAYGDRIEPELADFLGHSDRLAKKVESYLCLLYTYDAADDLLWVELGGGRINKISKRR